jgi:hypothetical protein
MLSELFSRLSGRHPSKSVAQTGKSGTTFDVDAVVPAEKPIWTETLQDSLARRFQRKVLILPEPLQPVINPLIDSLTQERRKKLDRKLFSSHCHPLIDAVHLAFSQHRPLVLSPDILWLVIAQGFGHHVAQNAEKLRPRLVRHQGRSNLTAFCFDLDPTSFEQVIAQFSSQIQQATDPVLYETLVCDFSTTTTPIRVASEVALMDTFSSYFTYLMRCICGIPKITITGTPEDWRRIRARVEVLETYGLEWWVSRLRPILNEFVLAADQNPTREFWKAIYKPARAYGDEVVTGWLADLFPYLGDAPNRRRNHVFEHERSEWALAIEQGVETKNLAFDASSGKGVRTASFPSGLSSAPVKLRFNDGSEIMLDFVAGFFAVEQDPSDLSVSPVISWSVTEPPPKVPVTI